MQKLKDLTFVFTSILLIAASLGLAPLDKDYLPVLSRLLTLGFGGCATSFTFPPQD